MLSVGQGSAPGQTSTGLTGPVFFDRLILAVVPPDRWATENRFRYQTGIPSPWVIVVPPGFENDLASIPRGFRWLVTGHGKSRQAAVVHDWLYDGRHPRKEADRIFREALKAAGMGWAMRSLMYSAVRAGGWLAYR